MIFNNYQTDLESDLVKSLDKEIYNDLIDYLNTIKFVQNLTAVDRRTIKDMPVDRGKVIVDFANPHTLEDMDYFRERALYYNKHGVYTHLVPNSNPNSEYAKFWKEEGRRWEYGLVRPDGEWIPGGLYFYWNYCQIWLSEKDKVGREGTDRKRGKRVQNFPTPWLGDYLFYHYMEEGRNQGLHGKLLKSRGMGFSFKMASLSPRNMYVYKGSGNPNFHLASDKTFLTGDKGVFGKVIDNLDWVADNTPFPRLRLVDSKKGMEVQLGYLDEYGARQGYLSSVYGISLKHDPDKARGIRGPLIHYEEDGLFPDLEKAWNVNLEAVQDGKVSFGYMLAGGTGGTEGASFEGSEKLFYYPESYNILGIPNVFDKNADGSSTCGFFWGAYLNRKDCYDESTGEPDVIKALVEILQDRYRIKRNSSDPRALTQKKAEACITPQDAVMRIDGTLFPVADLKDHVANISMNIRGFISGHYVGRLAINTEGKVRWELDEEYPVIRDFPIRDNLNKHGAVEIFEMPRRGTDGEIPRLRYIAGIDPIDDDHSTTNSLASIFIFDRFTDRIVAEYTGRPTLANDFYEIALRLLKFYNATANYENDKKGLFSYFSQKHALHYLADNPEILKDMDMQKGTNYGNKAKGTNSGVRINEWGRRLQADWLNKLAYGHEKEGEDEEGNEVVPLSNLQKIRSVGYVKELIAWNPDGNFDRVSAMGMLMILREDLAKYEKRQSTQRVKEITDDPFFKRFGANNKQSSPGWVTNSKSNFELPNTSLLNSM